MVLPERNLLISACVVKKKFQKKFRWNTNTLDKEMSEKKAHFFCDTESSFSSSQNLYNNHYNLEVNFEVLAATSGLCMQCFEQGGTG